MEEEQKTSNAIYELVLLWKKYCEETKEERKTTTPEGKDGVWFMKVQFHDFMRWLSEKDKENKQNL